jgi:hypothetical protein
MLDRNSDDSAEAERPVRELIENYRTLLNELALLTTVSVLLFGFLLASPGLADSELEKWLHAAAILMVATATLVFVLPVAYHHLQFPYADFDKFRARTHNWMRIGMPLLGTSLYLSLSLAIWSVLDELALVVAALPLAATVAAFYLRKGRLD